MSHTRFLTFPPNTTHTLPTLTDRLIAAFPKLAYETPTSLHIQHALYRSQHTQPALEGLAATSKPFAFLHIVTLSTEGAGAWVCVFPPSTAAAQATNPGSEQASEELPKAPPPTRSQKIHLPSPKAYQTFTHLLQTKLSSIWTPTYATESAHGYIYKIGVAEIAIAETKGGPSAGSVVVCVKVAERVGAVEEVVREIWERLGVDGVVGEGGEGILMDGGKGILMDGGKGILMDGGKGGGGGEGEVEGWCRVLARRAGRKAG